MKKLLLILIISVLKMTITQAQNCANADFENGTLSGWTGSYGDSICLMIDNICVDAGGTDPAEYPGINQGTTNSNYGNHTLMTSGYDTRIGGTILPRVYSPGTTSLRLGSEPPLNGENQAQMIMKTFLVEASTPYFIYRNAIVLRTGGHQINQEAYYKVRLYDEENNLIDCATYDVNATTAATTTGFIQSGNNYYKPWSAFLIPLSSYIGQTLRIEFTTSSCGANGGSHFGYAYLDAECGSAEIIASATEICSGSTLTLTAPEGVSSYLWSGPGIVGANDTQTITVNAAGNYTVTMATIGSTPCSFSLSTTISEITPAPVSDFTLYPDVEPLHYIAENHATGTTPLTYSWDWGDGNFDNIAYPSHTYDVSGNYTICLTITDANNCTDTYCSDYTFKTESPIAYINVVDPLTIGITQSEKEKGGLIIYPNPASNNLIVESVNAFGIYQLEDITGKVLLSGSITANKFSLDISNLSKGIYMISIFDGEKQTNKKIIKQ